MNKRNEQGQKHGPWEEYWSNGELEEIQYYIT